DEKTFNVGIGMRPEDIRKIGKSMTEYMEEIIRSPRFAPLFKSAQQVSEWEEWGVSVLGKRRPCAGDGWVLCGDAGTFAMPYSGEGCGPGMRTGKIAAHAIDACLTANDVSRKGLKRYEDELWHVLQPEVSGFRWLEFLLLHEGVYDWVVQRAANNPKLIEMSSHMQNHYALSQKMISPGTILSLLTTPPK
ncbi:MAG: hypothetical protein AABY11_04170, partial [archaeon]